MTQDVCEVVRIVSTHKASQGDFIEINKADFDEKKHKLFKMKAPKTPKVKLPEKPKEIKISEGAKILAEDMDFDYSELKGTGENSEITVKDIEVAIDVLV